VIYVSSGPSSWPASPGRASPWSGRTATSAFADRGGRPARRLARPRQCGRLMSLRTGHPVQRERQLDRVI